MQWRKWKCHSLSCVWLCDTMDCGAPGSSVHGVLQARILEWVDIPFSRGSSQIRDRTQASCIAGRFFSVWAIRETCSIYRTSYQKLFGNANKHVLELQLHKTTENNWATEVLKSQGKAKKSTNLIPLVPLHSSAICYYAKGPSYSGISTQLWKWKNYKYRLMRYLFSYCSVTSSVSSCFQMQQLLSGLKV